MELKRLCTELIPDDELLQVKNYITGNVSRRCELTFDIPSLLMKLSLLGKTLHDVVEANRKTNQADAALLMNVSKTYFSPERFIDCYVKG